MKKFQQIDLNKCLKLSGEYFEEFMDEIELCEHYVYTLDDVKSIVGYKHPDISDLKIEIFESYGERYIYSVHSIDIDLDIHIFSGFTIYTLVELISDKLTKQFNFDRYVDLVKFLEDGADNFMEHNENDNNECDTDYVYEKYIFAVVGDVRKYGDKNHYMKDQEHAKTIVLEKYSIHLYNKKPYLVNTGNQDDGVVVDIYKVQSDIVEEISSGEDVKLEKIADSDVWTLVASNQDKIIADGVKIKNVNQIYDDEKYADCDFQDWLQYKKHVSGSDNEYDIVDTFKVSDHSHTYSGQNSGKGNANSSYDNSIYTFDEYTLIMREFERYCVVNGIDTVSSEKYDSALSEWFVSNDATELRLQLESD